MEAPTLFLSAGDPSGDNASARLVTEIQRLRPGTMIFGLGGPRLKELGQEQLVDSRRLAVLGFWEVARQFLFFHRLMKRCVAQIEARRPSAIVLVDYPGFNLRLAARVRQLRIPIIYYISPQVWAWGGRRVDQISRLVDRMLCILPFESDFFAEAGVAHEFVGHYLLEDIPQQYVASPIPDDGHLALLPGSRPQEIDRHLRPMLAAAMLVRRRHSLPVVVAGMRGVYDYDRVVRPYADDDVRIVYDDPRRVINDARLALVASGTATLETAIIGRPMVVIYKTGWITYQIARRLVKLDRIALANLVLGEKVVPELIQREASPQAIAKELFRFLDEESYGASVQQKLGNVVGRLGGPGASERAARAILSVLDGDSGGSR